MKDNFDIIGKKFNKLTVIEFAYKDEASHKYFKCRCDCGNYKITDGSLLKRGNVKSCGCSKIKNLSGQKFGRLFVIRKSDDYAKNKRRWLCQCDCGNILDVFSSNLLREHTNSCGCQRGEKSKKVLWVGYGEISGAFWSSIRRTAEHRDIAFDIKMEEAWGVFTKQQYKCFLSNTDIYFAETLQKWKKGGTSASLDRIDSLLSYTKDNCFWTHKDVNRMRWGLTVQEFLTWTKLVTFPEINNYFMNDSDIKHAYNYIGYGLVSGHYMSLVKKHADDRNIEYNITAEDCWKKFIYQGGKCAITNIPLTFVSNHGKYYKRQTASIDRVDSKDSYFPENIQIVHKTINNMKLDFSQDYFIELCTKIHNNSENIKTNLKENYGIII